MSSVVVVDEEEELAVDGIEHIFSQESLHLRNEIQVYNVSSGKSTPQWLSESKKRALRKDEEYR